MKTKKPDVSGYSFKGIFVGVPNAIEYLTKLKQIAIEQNRSVSGQARQFIIDGIKVNKEKNAMYFLFALEPLKLISSLREFLTSIIMRMKKNTNKIILTISSNWRLNSFNSIKLLSIKVKNVKKPIERVIINIKTINIFFLIKSNIM